MMKCGQVRLLFQVVFYWLLLLLSSAVYASYIESTIGSAVVNDATASYYNPAALVLVKHPQLIPIETLAYFHSRFSGQSTTVSTHTTQTGSSSANTHYYLSSFYVGLPTSERVSLGVAIITNAATRNADENSILRYVQASNSIEDYSIVPAIGVRLTDYLSIGAGIHFSYLDLNLQPMTGFPGSNIADSQSQNDCDGHGIGGDVGLLLRPAQGTVIGFNYRSVTTYRLNGTSVYNGNPEVISNQYHFNLWTPARSALSINHFVTPQLGLIATVQRIQWSLIRNIHVNGIATLSSSGPAIVNRVIPYYLHDAWLLTLGSHYRLSPQCILRVAASYNQSPGNPHYQIANGDSYVLGASMGYELNKTVTIDGGYAHVFIKDQAIAINGNRFVINGDNEGSRDVVSLKLTFNL